MDFNGLYSELNKLKEGIKAGAEEGLKAGAEKVAEAARAKPGSYQPAVGPYPAWVKLKKGGSPLLKSGGLRGSISRSGSGSAQRVSVGGYGGIHEAGTARIPQRAFLGPALMEKKNEVLEEVVKGIRAKL